ncbi:hypothetical protein Tco_1017207 [Tanacetum coccineum]|uniref:Uncharacterized protein n=1 Tax=Tanacetum coccineum TaxID=301880 RepID=A0ABQ5FSU1_9ASTR
MYNEEDSDRYIAQCFVNGLYASDGEINLEKNDNLISNDYAVKLCLEYKVRKGKKLVKKELTVLLRGKIYFVQFIINPEEDEFEPGLIFGRSFLRSANAMVNFRECSITIQPDFDPFLLSSDEEKNLNLDDLETLLDSDIEEVPQTKTDLSPLVCKMGKGSRNKKKVMENIMYFNNGAGPSSSIGIPLTQEFNELRCRIYMSVWVAWRSDRRRLRGWSTDMHITGICTRVFLSIWHEFIMFRCRVLTTHLVMLSPSMTNTTSSTIRSSHHSSSMTMQRTSSVG